MTQISSTIDPKQSVASIVLAHSECATVFQTLRIDFCCKGEQSLELACAARERNLPEVIAALRSAIAERGGPVDPAESPTNLSNHALIEHIIRVHHEYLRKTLPFVGPLAAKVARVHGEHNPRLLAVDTIVQALTAELIPHLAFEEDRLFPAMLAEVKDTAFLLAEFDRMTMEHLVVGALLGRLRDETEEFTLPDWACTSYRTLFAELSRLEFDVLKHVHLENHVLLPRFS